MKDYESLSKSHFDGQAAEYDQRDTYYYSRNGKISCRDIAEQVRDLPYPDETFDIVTCSQSFHHYPYPEKAMQEAWRVLKKGGLYILSDTGIGGIGAWIDNHILFKLAKSGDCHTTNRKGIEKLMKDAGFTVTDSRQIKGMIYTVTGKKDG